MDYVGVYVAALRDSKGLTQPDFALKVGVSERTVRNIEAGRHAPRTTDLDNIAAGDLMRTCGDKIKDVMPELQALQQ